MKGVQSVAVRLRAGWLNGGCGTRRAARPTVTGKPDLIQRPFGSGGMARGWLTNNIYRDIY